MSVTAQSLIKRAIDIGFTLKLGTFDGVANKLVVSGLRCSAAITQSGGMSQGGLDLRIYGMTLSDMNKLAVIGPLPQTVQLGNTVSVMATAPSGAMSLAYQGSIANCWIDFQGMPDVALHLAATAAYEQALTMVAPSSYQAGADVALIMGTLAKTMGFTFENHGVSVKLPDSYFCGSAYEQAEACARAADINFVVDSYSLIIWPRGGNRDGDPVLISPETGLVGYPVKTALGVAFTCLYTPTIRFGGKIQMQSSLPAACGTWKVFQLDHNLESQTPGGQWFSIVQCVPVGFV